MSMSMGYVGGVLGRLGFGGSNISCMYLYVLAQDNSDRLFMCVCPSYVYISSKNIDR